MKKNQSPDAREPEFGSAAIGPFRREISDLVLALILAVLLPLVWFLALGWTTTRALSANDSYFSILPFFRDLIRTRGSWESVLYRPELLGGVIVHGIAGSLPIYRVTSWFGLSPLMCLNVTFLFLQFLFGWVGTRLAFDMAVVWSRELRAGQSSVKGSGGAFHPDALDLVTLVTAATAGLLISFAPVVGWRIFYGHPGIIMGCMPFLCALSILAARRAQRLSYFLVTMNFVVLAHTFQTHGHQLVFNSFVFGAPVLLAFVWPTGVEFAKSSFVAKLKEVVRQLLLPLGVVIAAFAVSLPVFSGMLFHAKSTDATRTLDGAVVTYSYITSTLTDWLSSIPWDLEMIPSGRTAFMNHEVNYPLGAIVLFLAMMPGVFFGLFRLIRKKRGPEGSARSLSYFGSAMLISSIVILLFSMKVEPVASLVLALLPPMRSFRVPGRGILIFALVVPSLSVAALLCHFNRPKALSKLNSLKTLAWGIAGVGLFFLPAEVREFVLWGVAVWICLEYVTGGHKVWVGAIGIMALFGIASVAAVKQRQILPIMDEEALIKAPEEIHNEVVRQAPALQSALTRASVEFQIGTYFLNTGYSMDVSTVDGYWAPPRRFMELDGALKNQPVDPTGGPFQTTPESPDYAVLKQLYNLAFRVQNQNGRIIVTNTGPTLGEAWFSNAFQPAANVQDLAYQLKTSVTTAPDFVRSHQFLDQADVWATKSALPAQVSPECTSARVLSVDALRRTQQVTVRTQSSVACPLTVSMTFSELLHASAGGVEIPVYPAYGSLTGVWVPAGANEVKIEARAKLPTFVRAAPWIGWILFALCLGSLAFIPAIKPKTS